MIEVLFYLILSVSIASQHSQKSVNHSTIANDCQSLDNGVGYDPAPTGEQ